VLPPSVFKPTGKAYPETVILRLIDAKGRPEVKIAASEEGAGLGFVGETDETQVKLEAQGSESSLTLLNKNGKQQRLSPLRKLHLAERDAYTSLTVCCVLEVRGMVQLGGDSRFRHDERSGP
jgi:hypothetical protein